MSRRAAIKDASVIRHDDAYLESAVLTASPHQLHLMVLEGAIRHAHRALVALESRDFEAVHLALGNSREFVGELIAGLNPEHAPELVGRMRGLFLFAYREFAAADLDHEARHIRDGVHVLELHRATWLELIASLGSGTAAAPAAAAPTQSPAVGRSWEA